MNLERRQTHEPGTVGDDHLALVAELYYREGLTQKEIATRLGLSRATIVNHIRQARHRGVVEIQIRGSAYTGSDQSRSLSGRYGLKDVYITRTATGGSDAEALRSVARLGASALVGLTRPGDLIGISWGRTIQEAAAEMPRVRIQGVEVCQLVGSMASDDLETSESSTIRIANCLDARCRTLHAPAIVSTAALAAQLRTETVVRNQIARFNSLTKAFFSVGDVDETTIAVASGIAKNDEWRDFRAAGARAVLCGHFINEHGKPIGRDFTARLIGVSLEQIRKTPKRICVAAGVRKRDPVLAAIAGGYVSHLVVDEPLADSLG